MDIIQEYISGSIRGWAEEIATEEFNLFTDFFVQFPFTEDVEGYYPLYKFPRKLLKRDTANYPQKTGDCVSFMHKNCLEYLQAIEILMGEHSEWHPIFPPYGYFTSRVLIGGGRIWGAGSTGTWMAKAVKDWGILRSDYDNTLEYSGSLADQWGNGKGKSRDYIEIAKKNLVKSTARITTWNELANGHKNGYLCGVCSNVGFQMTTSETGFHRKSGSWSHAMTIIASCTNVPGISDHGIILNSWGDCHGKLRCLINKDEYIPVGCLRVERSTIEQMLKQGDSYLYSAFDSFPARELPFDAFNVI